MSGTTTRLALPYPSGGDGPDGADVPYWMQALATALDGAALDDQGVLSSRPVSSGGSPGIRGRYYMVKGDTDATQNGILWRDNGTGWDRVGLVLRIGEIQGAGAAGHVPRSDGAEYVDAQLAAADVLHAADKNSASTQAFSGGVTSDHPTEGAGYAAGAGGTVSQAASKTTPVTLNKVCGQITTHAASLAGGARAVFQVNNSVVGVHDVIALCVQNTGSELSFYVAEVVSVFNGGFQISLLNTETTAAETVIINFAVIKAVAS